MNVRKMIAGGASALLAAGALAVGIAAPASAHTPTAWTTCDTLSVSATNYELRPASGEPQITIDNPDYVPGTPGSPAVGSPRITVDNPDYVAEIPAVTKTEYLYKQMVTGKTKWLDSKTWNPGLGWYFANETRTVEVTPAVPAVGTPTIEIDNPDYVAEVPATPAVGEPRITVDNPEYVEADETPNTVVVQIDGETVDSAEFGTSFTADYALGDQYVSHAWSVTITAWNDVDGSKGWTKTLSGFSEPCEQPGGTDPDPEKLTGSVLVDCEAETVTFNVENGNDTEVQVLTGFDQDGDGIADFGDGIIAAPNDSGSLVYTFDMLETWPTLTGILFLYDEDAEGGQGHVIATSDEFSTVGCNEEPVVNPANPTATATATCDGTDVILTNPLIGDAEQTTASFVIEVDGEFYGAYSVLAGGREEIAIEGSHLVEVYQAGTSEWKLIASAEAKTDCEVPPTEPEEPTEPTEPTEPKPEEPTTPEQPAPAKTVVVKTARATTDVDTLAQTGPADIAGISLLALALLGTGVGAVALGRRVRNAE